jgi:hypothetical protein
MFRNVAHGSSMLRLNLDNALLLLERLAEGSYAVRTCLESVSARRSKLPIAVLVSVDITEKIASDCLADHLLSHRSVNMFGS